MRSPGGARPFTSGIGILLLVFTIVLPVAGVAAQQATPKAMVVHPDPIAFPRDDGPHDTPIEWWYYTGHLFTQNGDRYGFELVVFKGEKNGTLGYASHFAIADNARRAFRYDQRLDVAPPDANSPRETGFDLSVREWRSSGIGGRDRLVAAMSGYAIDLALTSDKPPALHDGDGYADFGGGEFSYYYSRTRISVAGSLTVDGVARPVTGEAWFDHQWGDFASVVANGWDWFALQLSDGSELMLYLMRGPDEAPQYAQGSWIAPDSTVTTLERKAFAVTPTGTWTSARTGTTYPAGWTVEVPERDLSLTVTPALPDQELETEASTGVTYWEGEVTVEGTHDGAAITGLGYVELTGYTAG